MAELAIVRILAMKGSNGSRMKSKCVASFFINSNLRPLWLLLPVKLLLPATHSLCQWANNPCGTKVSAVNHGGNHRLTVFS